MAYNNEFTHEDLLSRNLPEWFGNTNLDSRTDILSG